MSHEHIITFLIFCKSLFNFRLTIAKNIFWTIILWKNTANSHPNFRDDTIFGKCFQNSLSARIWVILGELELFWWLGFLWWQHIEVVSTNPLAKFCVNIEHGFRASHIVPRIFIEYQWVESEHSDVWNPEHQPHIAFYTLSHEVFLCRDLVLPNLGFCDKYRTICDESCVHLFYVHLPERNIAGPKNVSEAWQKFPSSANVFWGHKILGKNKKAMCLQVVPFWLYVLRPLRQASLLQFCTRAFSCLRFLYE